MVKTNDRKTVRKLDGEIDLAKGKAETESFPTEVVAKLKTYVYRLIDPRNGETFYVGKGKGNRVFAHIHDEQGFKGDKLDYKMQRIREIHNAGFEVAHIIHRHGMDDKTAVEVEAALIDAYPEVVNKVGGVGGQEFGVMHAKEIIRRYRAEPAKFQHKALLICVNRTATKKALYDATRFAWKLNLAKAKQAEIVLAVQQGLIVGAFVVDEWLDATAMNFPLGPEDKPVGRFGFEGREAPESIKRLYVGKRVPDEYRKPGAAYPIKYTWGR